MEYQVRASIYMKPQNKAYLYAGGAVLMWSTVGSAFKLTLRYTTPVMMLLCSSFISILVLLGIILYQRKWNLLKSSHLRDLGYSGLLGILNPFMFYIVLFSAYDLLLTQEAMVLNFTWPVTLTILSIIILKQKIRIHSIIAIIISFIGILIIGTNGHILSLKFSNPFGVALALGSTLIWSLFWIYNIKDKRDEIIKLFLNFAFGFVYILILALIIYGFEQGAGSMEHGATGFGLRAEGIGHGVARLETGFVGLNHLWPVILGCIYIGIFEMGVAYVFWLKGLQLSTTTARVSSLIFFAPFISLIIINVAVGETIHLSTLAGLIFIIGGLLFQRIFERTTNQN